MIFDGSKSQEEREEIIQKFSRNDNLILIAMKCLDQGVDIPTLEKAVFLASSVTTREHVQRTGRLLRKNKFKSSRCESVKLFDILSLPTRFQYSEFPTIGESMIRYETDKAKFFLKYSENSPEAFEKLETILETIRGGTIKL